MRDAISARAGIAPLTTSDFATSACRVIAPMTTLAPSFLTPLSSARLPRSTRSVGRARRCFSVGISVMPPATSFTSSPAASFAASATEPALRYSNAYIRVSPLFRGHGGTVLRDRFPDAAWARRHVDVLHPQGRERVDDGVHHGARGADRARLAAAFDAERVVRAERDV